MKSARTVHQLNKEISELETLIETKVRIINCLSTQSLNMIFYRYTERTSSNVKSRSFKRKWPEAKRNLRKDCPTTAIEGVSPRAQPPPFVRYRTLQTVNHRLRVLLSVKKYAKSVNDQGTISLVAICSKMTRLVGRAWMMQSCSVRIVRNGVIPLRRARIHRMFSEFSVYQLSAFPAWTD